MPKEWVGKRKAIEVKSQEGKGTLFSIVCEEKSEEMI